MPNKSFKRAATKLPWRNMLWCRTRKAKMGRRPFGAWHPHGPRRHSFGYESHRLWARLRKECAVSRMVLVPIASFSY